MLMCFSQFASLIHDSASFFLTLFRVARLLLYFSLPRDTQFICPWIFQEIFKISCTLFMILGCFCDAFVGNKQSAIRQLRQVVVFLFFFVSLFFQESHCYFLHHVSLCRALFSFQTTYRFLRKSALVPTYFLTVEERMVQESTLQHQTRDCWEIAFQIWNY